MIDWEVLEDDQGRWLEWCRNYLALRHIFIFGRVVSTQRGPLPVQDLLLKDHYQLGPHTYEIEMINTYPAQGELGRTSFLHSLISHEMGMPKEFVADYIYVTSRALTFPTLWDRLKE